MKKTIILCDFDGTITEADVVDMLLDNFAPNEWEEIGKAYVNGSISHAQMNTRFAHLLNATPAQVDTLLKRVSLRPGFSQLLDLINHSDINFVVVSSGWDFYIERILKEYNPKFISDLALNTRKYNTTLQIISNKISYDSKNKRWNLQLLWGKNSCHLSSPCKGYISRALRKHFDQVIAIGNSESDTCMAESANIFFAFDTMQKICRDKGISAINVTDFYQIKEYLSQSL